MAVIKEYLENGQRTALKSYLSEMYVYPGLAHYLTAQISRLFGNDIVVALSYVTVTLLVACSFFLLLLTVPKSCRAGDIVYGLLCIAGFLVLSYLGVSIQNTVFEWFFFSQLAALALALVTLYIAHTFFRQRLVLRLIFTGIMLWIGAYVHLMMVIFLLGPCVVFAFTKSLYALCRREQIVRKILQEMGVELISYLMMVVAVSFLHPQVIAGKSLVSMENRQQLFVNFTLPQLVVISSVFFLILSAVYLAIIIGTKLPLSRERLMALSLYGGGYLVMLANWIAFVWLHRATQYSATKHFFSLGIFLAPCVVGLFFDAFALVRHIRKEQPPKPEQLPLPLAKYNACAFLLLVLVMMLFAFSVPTRHPVYNARSSHIFNYPQYQEIRKNLANIPVSANGSSVFIVSKRCSQSNFIGYMVNVLDLHVPRPRGEAPEVAIFNRLRLWPPDTDSALEALRSSKLRFDTIVLGDSDLFEQFGSALPNYRCYNLEDGRLYGAPG